MRSVTYKWIYNIKCGIFWQPLSSPFSCIVAFVESFILAPSVSQYTNAFAITQLCGVLCAPWNGLIMDRHKGKKLQPGKYTPVVHVPSLCFQLWFLDPCPLCRRNGAGGRPALFLPLSSHHIPAVPAVLSLCLTSFPPTSIPHLCSTSPQPLLPLRWECSVHQHHVSSHPICTPAPALLNLHACRYAIGFNLSGEEKQAFVYVFFSFPACHFGKLYGLVMSASAVVSLLQYPCFTLVKGALQGDPFYVGTTVAKSLRQIKVHAFFSKHIYQNNSFLLP